MTAAVSAAALALAPATGASHARPDRGHESTAGHSGASGKADEHATVDPTSTTKVSDTPTGAPPASARAQRTPGGSQRPGEDGAQPGRHNEEDPEPSTGESSNGYSLKNMVFHNGPLQSAPRIYLVFWGPNWFSGGDPSGVANRLHYFYSGLGGSAWGNVLKQFGTFTNPAGQYKGWLQDTSAVPAQPSQAQVAAAAQRAATSMNDYGYNAQYVIATPYGVVDQYSTAKGFCGWHNYAYTSATNWVTYTSLPYIPYLDDLGRGCGAGKVNGTSGRLDGVTIIAAHEYAETVNDPGLNAWYDSDGDENGDKCAWTSLKNYTLTNGYAFPVQPYWSNTWRTNYGYGCYYS